VREIFVNFRTGDQDMAAPFLYESLVGWFGADAIFFSSHSIEPGVDFAEDLLLHAAQCQVLLALVGPQWLTMAGPDGRALLADPEDWVRREIATALAADRRVVPILVGNAPRLTEREKDLPADIARLARAEHRYLRRRDLVADLDTLQKDMKKLIPWLRLRSQPGSGAHISAKAGIVRSGGSMEAVHIDHLSSPGENLSDIIGSASSDAGLIEGTVRTTHIGQWDRRSPAAAQDNPEEWGSREARPPELPT